MRLSWLDKFHVFTDELDGSAGGGPVTPGAPASATPAPTPGVGTSGVPATGTAPAGAGTPVQTGTTPDGRPVYTYPEDRSRWIPPHRYNELSERTRLLEQGLTNYQSRVRALMGVAEPEDPRRVELAKAMKEMFPGLAPFIDNPQLHEKLINGEFSGRGEIDGFQSSYWNRHAAEMTNRAVEQYAQAAGIQVDQMSQNRVAVMAGQLQAYISADPSGQRKQQYESNDPAFLSGFIADLRGFFVDPLRRTATTQNAQQVDVNRRLPSQRGPSGVPPAAGTPGERPKGKALHEAARQALLAGTNG